jgi:3-dehydroquinate dehydratase/shikimate dehydrogenase
MTGLAIAIKVESPDQVRSVIEEAGETSATILELRFDYAARLSTDDVCEIVALAKRTEKKLIATCRPSWEGGHYTGPEHLRINVLADAVGAGVDFVDIELIAVEKDTELLHLLRKVGHAQVIVSNHDFECRPDDLADRFERIEKQFPAIRKIAYTARTISESFSALDLMQEHHDLVISIAMGEAGLTSRILAGKLGGFLTFASLTDGAESAPGQVSIEQMDQLYRWPSIRKKTKVYGVVGSPVAHSMSPAIHNASFKEANHDGLYLPLLVGECWEEFKTFLDGVREREWLGFCGISVTIPHKAHALRYVKESGGQLEPLAERIGAVNTLLLDKDGGVSGYNTDYAGALNAVTETMGITWGGLKELRVAVIGAGGVGRAVVAGFCDNGCKVTITNRTEEKAKELAKEFKCKVCDLKKIKADIVVNCTSLGMHPNVDASALAASAITDNMVVFDTVYNPMETKLLKVAKAVGAKTVDGVSMFVEQAVAQFEMFTDKPAPKALMRRVVESNL